MKLGGGGNKYQNKQMRNWLKMNNSASALDSPFIMILIFHTLLSTKLQTYIGKVMKVQY